MTGKEIIVTKCPRMNHQHIISGTSPVKEILLRIDLGEIKNIICYAFKNKKCMMKDNEMCDLDDQHNAKPRNTCLYTKKWQEL